MNKTTYKQGPTFPPSGHGAGFIFAFLALSLVFIVGLSPWYLLLTYPSIWIIFAKTELDVSHIEEGYAIKKIGFFPFYIKRKISLQDFDAGVIKKVKVYYRTAMVTTRILTWDNSGHHKNRESYDGLLLKYRRKYEFETLFKGSTEEITQFIRRHLKNSNLKFYRGVPKPEFELEFWALK